MNEPKTWAMNLELFLKRSSEVITGDFLMKTTLVRMITLVYWIPISAHTTYIARVSKYEVHLKVTASMMM